jgi:hypothetical protein
MAKISLGNDLTTPVQIPGGKVTNDGYGLLTATVVWKADAANDMSVGNRGSTCPINSDCYAHRFGVTYDSLGVATITVDYIGIDSTINGGLFTNPQVGAANGLTSQHISTNPNFFTNAGSGYYDSIAGDTFTVSDIGPTVKDSNGAAQKSYVGKNGACFERSTGGRFIGFVDPSYKHFYGKTNYLAPQSTFSGHFYTTEEEKVTKAIQLLGTSSNNNNWGGELPDIVPTYAGDFWQSSASDGEYNQLLLSQVNIEDFGLLYKVNYEVRYNLQGWPDEVYPAIASA